MQELRILISPLLKCWKKFLTIRLSLSMVKVGTLRKLKLFTEGHRTQTLPFQRRKCQCEEKAALLSLIDLYAVQFILKSRNIPVTTDLYEPNNLDLNYPELLRKCSEVEVNISEKEIEMVEQDTRTHAKGPGVFSHQAGRIGASLCGPFYHTNPEQPALSLTNSICYPHLFKLNNKAIRHG